MLKDSLHGHCLTTLNGPTVTLLGLVSTLWTTKMEIKDIPNNQLTGSRIFSKVTAFRALNLNQKAKPPALFPNLNPHQGTNPGAQVRSKHEP